MNLGRLIVDVEGVELNKEDKGVLQHPNIGGVILFSRNFVSVEQITLLIKHIKSLRSPSLLVYVDQEGQRVQRFKNGLTILPSIESLGEKYNNDPEGSCELSYDLGWLIGYELVLLGVDVNTMPVLDIDYKRSNVVNKRCFSGNPKIVTLLSESFINGAKDSGISSICKHYPGHGYAKTDSHVELPEDNRDFNSIFNNDLLPYKKAIDINIEGIMTSHVLYKKIDTFPPTLSRKWLQVLKNDLRYKGIIYSDDLSMKALQEFGNLRDNLMNSIDAGCDCQFICNDRKGVINILDDLIIKKSDVISNKLIKLGINNNNNNNNTINNEKRLKVIGKLERISETKQISIVI